MSGRCAADMPRVGAYAPESRAFGGGRPHSEATQGFRPSRRTKFAAKSRRFAGFSGQKRVRSTPPGAEIMRPKLRNTRPKLRNMRTKVGTHRPDSSAPETRQWLGRATTVRSGRVSTKHSPPAERADYIQAPTAMG